jgi:hypothetical protein
MNIRNQRIILFICGLPFLLLSIAVIQEAVYGLIKGSTNESPAVIIPLSIMFVMALATCWGMIFYKKILSVYILSAYMLVAAGVSFFLRSILKEILLGLTGLSK